MTQAQDLIEGWDRPAAVFAADGAPVCANRLFGEASPPLERLRRLHAGGRLEDGGLGWTARALSGGERLIVGEPLAPSGQNGRERYLAALSHELRTPLNGVLGMAGLLAATRLDADQKAYVQALRDTGAHLLGLVNDVLDLARLESGQIDLEPGPVEVERLLQGVCELLSPRAHEKGLEIAWFAQDCPARVLADDGRLRQILFNLAGNAVKFTETGGVLIHARGAGREADGVRLRFTIADTGPGVPEAEQGRIFEEYARVQGAGARLEGTGLGLAIVRRLAAAHAGALGLEVPPGGGSRFWFEASFPEVQAQPPGRPLEGLTVRAASPSPIVREAAARQIEACGGRALTTSGLPRGRDEPADVLLVDRALAARPPGGMRAIVLLAAEERGEIEGLRAAGFDGYLIKPLRRASLAERILTVVGGTGDALPARTGEDERAAPALSVGARVLLAEDNPINALLARTLLEREGCAVECAANGSDALAAGRAGGHDLILMDVRMPGMDGIEAAKALRAAGLKTPIVALTADAFEDDRKACLAAGMDDFLAKPLEVGALRAVLARWARGRPFTPGEAKDKLVC